MNYLSTLCCIVFCATMSFAQSTLTFDPRGCNNLPCTANDFSASLNDLVITDALGVQTDFVSCTPGEVLTVSVVLTLTNNSGSTRGPIFFYSDVVSSGSGSTVHTILECHPIFIGPMSSQTITLTNFDVNCNGNFSLTDVVIGWHVNTPGATCESGGPACNNVPFPNGKCIEIMDLVLPVELIAFEGAIHDQKVVLEWITASEEQNAFFAVEHSKNGKGFNTIGRVDGAGTTFEIQRYKFETTVQEARTHYYRLKQVDEDGAYTYSEIITVSSKVRTPTIELYPNPVQDVLQLKTDLENYTLTIFDLYGRVIAHWENPSGHNFRLEKLEGGVYNISIQYADQEFNQLLVKQ